MIMQMSCSCTIYMLVLYASLLHDMCYCAATPTLLFLDSVNILLVCVCLIFRLFAVKYLNIFVVRDYSLSVSALKYWKEQWRHVSGQRSVEKRQRTTRERKNSNASLKIFALFKCCYMPFRQVVGEKTSSTAHITERKNVIWCPFGGT